jgi:hypothetical protein
MTQVTRRDLLKAATVALALPVARTGAASRDLPGPESQTAKPESRESMFVSLNPSLTRAMPWQEFAQLAA